MAAARRLHMFRSGCRIRDVEYREAAREPAGNAGLKRDAEAGCPGSRDSPSPCVDSGPDSSGTPSPADLIEIGARSSRRPDPPSRETSTPSRSQRELGSQTEKRRDRSRSSRPLHPDCLSMIRRGTIDAFGSTDPNGTRRERTTRAEEAAAAGSGRYPGSREQLKVAAVYVFPHGQLGQWPIDSAEEFLHIMRIDCCRERSFAAESAG